MSEATKRALIAAAAVTSALAFIAVLVFIVVSSNASDDAAAAQERRDFQRANTVCGSPPQSIHTHGPSWSYGAWIEVRCADGSKRAIR